MPNWCSNVNVYWAKKAYRNELENFFQFMRDENKEEGRWLGELLTNSGADSERCECRGYVTSMSEDIVDGDKYVSFTVWTDTAWKPMPEAMRILCRSYSHVHLAYTSEEPGAGIFETNDKRKRFFSDAWRIETILFTDDDTAKAIYEKYPELLDDGPSYLTEEEGLEALSDMFQMDVPDELLENEAAWNELKGKSSALRDKLKKEFPKLDSLYLSYRHVAYI